VWIVVPKGSVTIAVVANSGEGGISRFSKLDSLNMATTTEMFGQGKTVIYSGKSQFSIDNSVTSVSVTLKRVIAKVTVIFDKQHLNPDVSIDITKVQLKNVPVSVLYFGGNTPCAGGVTSNGDYITVNTQPNSHEAASPLYMFENLQGVIGNNTIPSLKSPGTGDNLCSYLEITANYSSPAKSGTVIYRSYLGENNTNDFNIFRETHYKESVKFNGTSINEISWRLDISNLTDITYHITTSASPAEGGVVYGEGHYYYGYYPSLLAVAAENYRFSGWSPPMVPVTENKHYTAIFEYIPPYIAVTSLSLCTSQVTLYTGESYQITPNINPHNATQKSVLWSSSAPDIVTCESTGFVSGIKAGTSLITATSACGGYTASCIVTVNNRLFELNTYELTLRYGESLSIGYNAMPAATPVWSSDNPTAASVTSSGLVTAGYTTTQTYVRAIANGIERVCQIIIESPSVSVTGIVLDKNHITLTQGGYQSVISATVTPANATNKEIIWSSSQNSVAMVSNGVVTSNLAGSTVITATTVDGGYTASCYIDVVPPIIPVSSLSLCSSLLKIDIGNKQTLIATIYPHNATNRSVTWTSSQSNVASVNPVTGEITAHQTGVTAITATSEDGGYTAQCVVNVYLPLHIETDIHEIFTYNSFTDEITSAQLILFARLALERPSDMSIVNSVSSFVWVSVNYSYTLSGTPFSGTTTLYLNSFNNNDYPTSYVTGISELFSFDPPMSEPEIIEALSSFSYSVVPGSVYASIYHITW
ncbi:MAG: Ig-like domain-containing protein, partial [Bacteroidales bacterium]|nr:Ig-like domain-containing protein [Bacteroidales bacterium]